MLLGENDAVGDEAGKDETDPPRAPCSRKDEHLVARKGSCGTGEDLEDRSVERRHDAAKGVCEIHALILDYQL